MEVGLIFSGCAVSSHIIAYILYNRNIARQNCRPSITGWLLGSFVSILNAISYFLMTGDFIKTILPAESTLFHIFTIFMLWRKGNFVKIDTYDKLTFVIGLLVIFVWWRYQNASYANLLLQFCYLISMIPIYRNELKDNKNERPLPWFLWALAHTFNTGTVIARWQKHWPDIIYPTLTTTEHVAAGLLALRKTKSPSSVLR